MSYNGEREYQAWCDGVLVGHIIANVPDSNRNCITKVVGMTFCDNEFSFKRVQFDFALIQKLFEKRLDDSVINKLGFNATMNSVDSEFMSEKIPDYAIITRLYDPNLMQIVIVANWEVIEITPEIHDEIFQHDFFVPIETEVDVNMEYQRLKSDSEKSAYESQYESLKQAFNNQIIYGTSSDYTIYDESMEKCDLSNLTDIVEYSIPKSIRFTKQKSNEPFYRTIERERHTKPKVRY